MPLHQRIRRLEREHATLPDGRRRCRQCRDGAGFAPLTRFDGVAPWGNDGEVGECCTACGRTNPLIVDVQGIDPARL